MNFPIYLKSNIVGNVYITQNNNKLNLYAECEYTCDDILRLFCKEGNGKISKIGVLEPLKNGKMYISKIISAYENTAQYYLDDGTGKYILQREYKAPFYAGKEHKYAYLLTACKIEKIENKWFSYLIK